MAHQVSRFASNEQRLAANYIVYKGEDKRNQDEIEYSYRTLAHMLGESIFSECRQLKEEDALHITLSPVTDREDWGGYETKELYGYQTRIVSIRAIPTVVSNVPSVYRIAATVDATDEFEALRTERDVLRYDSNYWMREAQSQQARATRYEALYHDRDSFCLFTLGRNIRHMWGEAMATLQFPIATMQMNVTYGRTMGHDL